MVAKLVTGLLHTWSGAERAIERVIGCGYRRDAISIVMSHAGRGQRVEGGTGSRATAGADVATSGAAEAVGAFAAFPDLGIVAAGPIEAALAAGGADGLVGALVAAGVPEHRARVHEACLQRGEILVGVHAQSQRDAEILEMILEVAGAENVRSDSAMRRPYDSFI
ncbi:hypothetical protein [Sorangium sp. So ce1024]|uniref:hypothetical protein n=1 Tax=unclassified Sorangium TaxID=2621164 RepID=UPI003F004D57